MVEREGPQIMASEDFPHMMKDRPGAYLNIGTGLEATGVHHPGYDFNDAVLPLGASFWARLVETRLGK
jgi:hippurate hydrolase